jgi:predicted transcriptional regulator
MCGNGIRCLARFLADRDGDGPGRTWQIDTLAGRIVPQLASMPDGRIYLWIARTISQAGPGWGAPGKTFSIGLGCDLQHAARLVYSQGMDLRNTAAATPIGMGCKVCERGACPQRAFPYVATPLQVNENESGFVPYGG